LQTQVTRRLFALATVGVTQSRAQTRAVTGRQRIGDHCAVELVFGKRCGALAVANKLAREHKQVVQNQHCQRRHNRQHEARGGNIFRTAEAHPISEKVNF
jgi:hypothetical protein